MISDDQIQLMKPGVKIINAARGGILDEEAFKMIMVNNCRYKLRFERDKVLTRINKHPIIVSYFF